MGSSRCSDMDRLGMAPATADGTLAFYSVTTGNALDQPETQQHSSFLRDGSHS